MDVPDYQKYYKVYEFLLQVFGMWPNQTRLTRRSLLALFGVANTSLLVAVTMAMIKSRDDLQLVLDGILPCLCILTCIFSVTNLAVNSDKMSELWNRIENDWKACATSREITVFHEYARSARRTSLMMAVAMSTVIMIFASLPILTMMKDFLLTGSAQPGQFPYPVYYYYIDLQQHYFWAMAGIFVFSITSVAGLSSAIVAFTFHMHHVCGVFVAIGKKLERIGLPEETSGDKTLETLVTCIVWHNRAFEFTKILESTWSIYAFYIMASTTLEISLTAVQITRGMEMSPDTWRYIFIIVALLFSLFALYYTGQMLMDHSASIADYIHRGKWYRVSVEHQKILNFMLMRCNIPCQLYAANFWIMSLETYMVMLKAASSYVTLMRSMQ